VYHTVLSFGLVYHLGDGPLFDHGMIPSLMDLCLSLGCILWLLEPRYSVCEYAIPVYLYFISSISFMILLCMHQFSIQCDFSFRLLICALRSKTLVPTQALFTSSSPHSHRIRNHSSYCEKLHIEFVSSRTALSHTSVSFSSVKTLPHFASPNPQA
jgi:hypothetical protein